jgi:predicted RNA-binding Zn-ribbon protein involved in translation (DUF1610 family)
MPRLDLDPDDLSATDADWEGNNAAFACPLCSKVFIVSAFPGPGRRECPNCGNATGFVEGGRKKGGRAWIEWVTATE